MATYMYCRLLVLVLCALCLKNVASNETTNTKQKMSSLLLALENTSKNYHEFVSEELRGCSTRTSDLENKMAALESELRAGDVKQKLQKVQTGILNKRVKELESRSRNAVYDSWNNYIDTDPKTTEMTMIKNMTFPKKQNSSGLKIEFYSNFGLEGITGGHYRVVCTKYNVLFNGKECTDPAAIDGTILMQSKDDDAEILIPSVLGGVCNNVTSGAVNITIRAERCGSEPFAKQTITGWQMQSRIMVEELFN